MKKLLIALLVSMIPHTAMALEELKSGDDLSKLSKEPLAALVLTDTDKDTNWPMYKKAIEEYEKTHTDVKFFLAPLQKNPDFMGLAIGLGIQVIPTTFFSENGMPLVGVPGSAKDAKMLSDAIVNVKEMIVKVKAQIQQELERQQKENAIPPAPKPKEEGSDTIDYHPREPKTAKVEMIA